MSGDEELFAKWKEMERKGGKESSDAEIGMNNGRRAMDCSTVARNET